MFSTTFWESSQLQSLRWALNRLVTHCTITHLLIALCIGFGNCSCTRCHALRNANAPTSHASQAIVIIPTTLNRPGLIDCNKNLLWLWWLFPIQVNTTLTLYRNPTLTLIRRRSTLLNLTLRFLAVCDEQVAAAHRTCADSLGGAQHVSLRPRPFDQQRGAIAPAFQPIRAPSFSHGVLPFWICIVWVFFWLSLLSLWLSSLRGYAGYFDIPVITFSSGFDVDMLVTLISLWLSLIFLIFFSLIDFPLIPDWCFFLLTVVVGPRVVRCLLA